METVRLGKFTVTTLPRTLVDLAAVCPAPRGAADALGDALDTAQRLHPTTARQLQRVLRDLGAGVKGVERLRALLAERHGSTDSSLESRAVRRIRDAGLSTPELQYTIFDERGYIMRADCAWPDERLVLHVDGYRYHQQRTRFERDRVAVSRLAAAGWLSMWVTHRSLESNQWLENLRTALAARAPHLQAG
jgi:very-short-patch-repair endonuclease